jgi:hypothetical protein
MPTLSVLFMIKVLFIQQRHRARGPLTDSPMSDVSTIHFPIKVYLPYAFVCAIEGPLQRWSVG